MNYNYVILGSQNDFFLVSYNELMKREDAIYLKDSIDTKNIFLQAVKRFHTSPRINNVIHLPFQRIWNRFVFRHKFNRSKPICFVFFPPRIKEIRHGIIPYLRKKYPDCKLVLFYQDLVTKSVMPNIEDYRDLFDLIISFDQEDSKKYNILYHPLVYSSLDDSDGSDQITSDVYFVGKAKDRLKKIIAAYEVFRNAGLKCDFHIIGANPDERQYEDEIIYQDQMPYLENIKRIRATKCMLEVMQGGGHGFTLRYCEAIMYDKKIITDNPEIENAPFFDRRFIQTFESAEDIDPTFAIDGSSTVDYQYKDKLSPVRLLEFIDAIIC